MLLVTRVGLLCQVQWSMLSVAALVSQPWFPHPLPLLLVDKTPEAHLGPKRQIIIFLISQISEALLTASLSARHC